MFSPKTTILKWTQSSHNKACNPKLQNYKYTIQSILLTIKTTISLSLLTNPLTSYCMDYPNN